MAVTKSKLRRDEDNDEDLADLLGDDKNSGTSTAKLTLDHVTQDKQILASPSRRKSKRSLLEMIVAYLSMIYYYHPWIFAGVVVLILVLLLVPIATLLFNPTEHFGHIAHDHSNIQSIYDLSMKDVDHWCLRGDNDSCKCEDPLLPTSRAERKSWVLAFKANRKLVKQYQNPAIASGLDVAFIGESVVEEMDGRWMGQRRPTELSEIGSTFKTHFSIKSGAKYEGVALGIAGDTAPNVLWRLMHGEMADTFRPKVWWVSLGMNDLGRMQCSEEIVVMGVLRVVEEILTHQPKARVVINSLFPMVNMRGGLYPMLSDVQDSVNPRDKRGRNPSHRVPARIDEGAANATNPAAKGRKKSGGARKFRVLRKQDDTLARRKRDPSDTQPIRPKQHPSDLAYEADAEEVVRDKKGRKKFRHQKDPVNPKLIDKDSIHKFKPGTAHMIRNKLPLWTSVRAINRDLAKFARNHDDRVSFFDATDIFASRENGHSYVLRSESISARGHPTPLGFLQWEDAIVKHLDTAFAKLKTSNPDIFSASNDGNNKAGLANNDPKDVDSGIDDNFGDEAFLPGDDYYAL